MKSLFDLIDQAGPENGPLTVKIAIYDPENPDRPVKTVHIDEIKTLHEIHLCIELPGLKVEPPKPAQVSRLPIIDD